MTTGTPLGVFVTLSVCNFVIGVGAFAQPAAAAVASRRDALRRVG